MMMHTSTVLPSPGSYVVVQAGGASLEGNLAIPANAQGIVLFAHGSGSSHRSPRNRYVADVLRQAGLATLLFDLLTPGEEAIDLRTGHLRFDINLLSQRMIGATRWVQQQHATRHLAVGYFGASTGSSAALVAAAALPEAVAAVVSRGGRPDLATTALPAVLAPTLLIVGANDIPVIWMNQKALQQIQAEKRLDLVPGATHLFEEPGALEQVAQLASQWFGRYLGGHASDSEQPAGAKLR